MKNNLYLKDLCDSITKETLEIDSIEEILNRNEYIFTEPKIKTKKFENIDIEIYKPKNIRGIGCMREGFCEICKKWYKLKTSSYWYHMNYKHGINSYGIKYPEPKIRELGSKVEGFCYLCSKWIFLGRFKEINKFIWFRHWQKEHTKDIKNRRRGCAIRF